VVEVFIQGLRRSSTTFLFDVLLADARFGGWYEPLAEAKRPAIGGGSRMSEVDFFEKIRAARREYGAEVGLDDLEVLNHGAPRDADLELESTLPEVVIGYVRYMLRQSEFSVLKFVRAWRKLGALGAAFPRAHVLHIIRDPRAVVTSFLFGKGQKNKDKFKAADDFFELRNAADGPRGNQGLQVAHALMAAGDLALENDAPQVAKLLGVWQHHFRSSHRDGVAQLGARYTLIRHESFVRAPEPTVAALYDSFGAVMPDSVRAFLREKVDARPRIFESGDARWRHWMKELGMADDLAAAGYDELAQEAAR
jgi:Sulfotransferase family